MPRRIKSQPCAKNGLPADYLFFQRKYYNTSPLIYPSQPNLPKPINIWYEKPLFGKIDTQQRYVFPNPAFLKPIYKDLSTIDFVADAYKDFVEFVNQAAASIRTCMTSIIDVNTPTKALRLMESVPALYYNYFISRVDQGFLNLFLSDKRKNEISSFDDYMMEYIAYVEMNSSFPHTLSGFLASNKVSNRSSGMIIEFSKDQYDRDNIKWKKYLSSDFFSDYARIAGHFGFYIDKNVPWSIVANLNSKGMKKYMEPYGIKDATECFNTNFLQAEYISYISFKKYMFASYNSFITFAPLVERLKIFNCMRTNTVDSTYTTKRIIEERPIEFNKFTGDGGYTFKEFTDIYSDEYLLKKYLTIRLLENKIRLSPRRHAELVTRIIYKFKKSGLYNATLLLNDALFSYTHQSKKSLTSKKTSTKMGTNKAASSSKGTNGTGY